MGLDCYAVIVKDAPTEWFQAVPDTLPHSMLSLDGHSFHGTAFAALIDSLADIDLYSAPMISAAAVQDIAESLTTWVAEHPNADWIHPWDTHIDPISFAEIQALAQWFAIAAEHGCALQSWW